MNCKRYKTNPITKVILKIQFPQILSLSPEKPPDKFQNVIMDKFPYVKERRGEDFSFKLTPTAPVISRKPKLAWEFQSKDQTKQIFVNEKSITFELSKYTHFDDFFKMVQNIFEEFTKIYNIGVFKIGLRYINEIEVDEGDRLDWEGYIQSSLTHVTGVFLDPSDQIARSMHTLELNEEDYTFRFVFGMFNSEYPNPITKKEFVLDYDCITKEDLERNEVYPTIERFHKIIYKWFEKSIDQKLRDKWGCEDE